MGPWRPVVSNDGRRVLARTAGPEGAWFEYPVDGGPAVPARGISSSDRALVWSAEGRWLYVMHGGMPVAVIDRVDLTTGLREKVREVQAADSAGNSKIAALYLTPDARSVVYTVHRGLSELYAVDGLR
jgi:hypothetical protein